MSRPYLLCLFAGVLAAQAPTPGQTPAVPAPAPTPKPLTYTVETGTRIPLNLLNSVSTKHSQPGDVVYLQTAFPVMVSGRIIIPIGSYVTGTVTQVKRPAHAKGSAELFVRFDSLTLPNGVTRKFSARMGGVDGNLDVKVDRAEGKISADTDKPGEARTVGETASVGAGVGGIAGAASGHAITGIGIGAGAGAAAGLIAIMMSHGPDAVLPKGSTVEMVLDRPLSFSELELN